MSKIVEKNQKIAIRESESRVMKENYFFPGQYVWHSLLLFQLAPTSDFIFIFSSQNMCNKLLNDEFDWCNLARFSWFLINMYLLQFSTLFRDPLGIPNN